VEIIDVKGKPSVLTNKGKTIPIKAIVSFIEGGVTVEETMEELDVSKETIEWVRSQSQGQGQS
jgi:orotate phosphoribosyltransferase-like protein